MNKTSKHILIVTIIIILFLSFNIYLYPNHSIRESVYGDAATCHNNVVSAIEGGQLGNLVWEYMSLLSVLRLYKDKYNMFAHYPEALKTAVASVFEGVNVTRASEEVPERCRDGHKKIVLHLDEKVEQFDAQLQTDNVYLVLDVYSARYEDVFAYGMDRIKAELRFHDKYIQRSQDVLNKLAVKFGMDRKEAVYVGIHYRGTDYDHHLARVYNLSAQKLPNYKYYINAMNHFKERYSNVIFILVSIDHPWLKKNVPFISQKHANLSVNPNSGDGVQDMALLAQCDHNIINYGTYGITAALFAGGTTFCYDLKLPLDYRGPTLALGIARISPNWHVLS